MAPNTSPSHVAILVRSASRAAERLAGHGFKIGEAEEFEGEGTREIYVEFGKSNSLLLMQPIGPGAYQRAMAKRGPGLHHLAIDVLDLDAFLKSLSGSGWLLHPSSVGTIQRLQTAYLARPGFPALIEVHQKKSLSDGERFVRKVRLPLPADASRLIAAIGLTGVVESSDAPASLDLGQVSVAIADLG